MKPITRRLLLALSTLALATSAVAQADPYPNRPIRVVFPYPPGSPLDAIGRVVVERAGRALGQPMVFDNKPGANGILGQTLTARAAPDGYTLLLSSTSAFLLNSFVRKDLGYDPERSFVPITPVADIPVALVVSGRLPVNSAREFVQHVKAHPGQLNYGSVGGGSFNHLLMEQIKVSAGIDMQHVPFQGAGPVATELLAGRIDASILAPLGPWKGDQVKVLAMMSAQRHTAWPNVPTAGEAFPGFRAFTNWMGFFAPTGTPAPVLRRLSEAFNGALQQPDVRARIEEQQWTVTGGSPDQFRKMLEVDLKVIADMVQSAGVKPE